MTFLTIAAFAAALGAPQAEVSTVDGATVAGPIDALTADAVTVATDAGPKSVPLDSVLEVRLTAAGPAAPAEPAPVTLRLADGGTVGVKDVTAGQRKVTAVLPSGEPVELPQAAVRSIRFRGSDPAVEAKWDELLAAPAKKDLLVVRNGDVLDRLEGTVGRIEPAALHFLVGETDVPVPRDKPKLFGVIYAAPPAAPPKPTCVVRLRNGDVWPAARATLAGDRVSLSLPTGASFGLPAESVEAIDYGLGKIRFLSAMEPTSAKGVTFIGDRLKVEDEPVFVLHADRNDDGEPISIERRTFRRGVVIHSKATVTYRLGGDYRRFVAVAGIEDVVRPRGDLTVTISADGRELFSRPVLGTEPPFPIDLDVSGARELTIFVDFAGNADISDHLALGDARLIK